MGGSRDM